MEQRIKYIKGFDGLRAVSILLVLVTHLGLSDFIPNTSFVMDRLWFIISGDTGVQMFFTLSGFLITLILLKEKKDTGSIKFGRFYLKRFLRLLPPLLILYPLVLIAMLNGWIIQSSTGLIYSVFYIYNFIPNYAYTSELGHTWSLAVEEQFYFTWPFVLAFIRDRRVVKAITIIVIILSAFLLFYIPSFEMAQEYRMNRWFLPAIAPIMIGSLGAVVYSSNKERVEEKLQSKWTVLILCLLLFISPLYFPKVFLITVPIVQAFGLSLLLLWIASNQNTRFVALLNNRMLNYVGKISYGLYVYQGFFLGTGPGGNIDVQLFPLNIILVFAVAILSYELIEKPVLRLKNRI